MKRTSLRIPPGIRIFTALLLFLAAGSSRAAGIPGGSAPTTTDNVASPASPAPRDHLASPASHPPTDNVADPEASAPDIGWADRSHTWVEEGLFDTVVWFDRFFGDERMVVPERPTSFLRWKTELRWDQVDRFSFRSMVRASLQLPRLKKRWRLVFTSESRGDPTTIIPEDPGNPGLNPASQVRSGSTELVYNVFRTPRTTLDARAGVQLKIPPNAFLRTRFQHARPIAHDTLGRFTATAYWDERDGFGESNQLDLERRLAPPTLLLWSNYMNITEKDRWWTWGTELSLLHKLSEKSAITFSGGVSGSTHPSWVATNYRVLARYRRNVWRKWLFLEGEPDIHWPRKEDGSRKAVWGATLRMEVLFAGVGPDPRDKGGGTPRP